MREVFEGIFLQSWVKRSFREYELLRSCQAGIFTTGPVPSRSPAGQAAGLARR